VDITGEEEWLRTGSHTACPACGDSDIRVQHVLTATGPAHLAGAQLKFSATGKWVYRCFACGAEGDATPKTAGERGKWVDGQEHSAS
jgi:predicted RNA-binding Zn-ribbon protein involved in translation (DUF1610 family)